jgi:hypothetical protein
MDAVVQQIETITGKGLMGRQEAIDTGNQEQYFLQRKLFQDFMKVGDPEQANRLMESVARGQELQNADLQAARGLETLGTRGQEQIQTTLGPASRAANVVDAERHLRLTEYTAEALYQSSGSYHKIVQDTLSMVKGFQDFAEGGVKKYLEGRDEDLKEEGTVKGKDVKKHGAEKEVATGDYAAKEKQKALENKEATADIGTAGRQQAAVKGTSTAAIAGKSRDTSPDTAAVAGELRNTSPDTAAVAGKSKEPSHDIGEMLKILSNNEANTVKSWDTLSENLTNVLKEIADFKKSSIEQKEELSNVMINVMIDPTKVEQVVEGRMKRQSEAQQRGMR